MLSGNSAPTGAALAARDGGSVAYLQCSTIYNDATTEITALFLAVPSVVSQSRCEWNAGGATSIITITNDGSLEMGDCGFCRNALNNIAGAYIDFGEN